jgi:predicted nucleic acid-binding protein
MLWLAEGISAIRGAVYTRLITADEGRSAIEDLLTLGIETRPMSPEQCRSGFEWAGRLGQARAYDGFYLALAEELGAEFWTADRRLANAARQAGATWAHWIGES